ncbi:MULTISPECIES: ATP-binding protein [Streptomyces]|uniref:Anti-sigma regulatory factor (Ser/Thr protein kinase) n=1 Tax=Streptomyces demainii TaxID=588122 RepID=A0ABT9KYK7_9ACTN|nr:ATP-binding protein [Streptomyces demainii]MDP9613523.1 anti-sigma regulatory factor (Ser/Thr protein kinase) [Streptomyces demainii]
MNAEIAPTLQEFAQRLSATRRGARLARRLALQQLDAWGIPYGSPASLTVSSVVAELAANAATHGRVPGRDFRLHLVLHPHAVRIEVTDSRSEKRPPAPGRLTPPPANAETGRGLLLVQALSLAWGVEERPVGKTVWAECALR